MFNLLRRAVRVLPLCAAFVCGPATAAVLVDQSGTGPTSGVYVNRYNTQNFLVRVDLAQSTTITAFEIFTLGTFAQMGEDVLIKIRKDVGGQPSDILTFDLGDQIDAITGARRRLDGKYIFTDMVTARSEFAPLTLDAGTYWFGMTGIGSELGWASFNNGGPYAPTDQLRLLGNNVQGNPNLYDLGFRLYDDQPGAFPLPSAVPEPTTWAMMIIGFGLAGIALRRSRPALA